MNTMAPARTPVRHPARHITLPARPAAHVHILPLAKNGCANISSVRFGVNVMLTLVSMDRVFCCRRPKT